MYRLSEIVFVAKLHKQNGFSFYLPTKLIRFFNLEFNTWNNTIYITPKLNEEEIRIDASMTQFKDTWKASFYSYDAKGLKPGKDYLIRIPIV